MPEVVIAPQPQANGAAKSMPVEMSLATAEGVTGNKTQPQPTPTQAPATEAAKPETPKPAEPTASSRMAELAKKERGLALARMKLGQEREALAKEKAEHAELARTVENAKRNPAAYLKKLYGDDWFGQLSKVYTEGVPPGEMIAAAVDDKLDAFRKEQAAAQEAQAKAQQEAQAKEAQQLKIRFAQECRAFVDSKPDDYELIRLSDAHDWVPQLIEKEFERSGKFLTSQEAADRVELHLTEQAEKAAASKKLQAKLQQQQPAKRTPAATLSNDLVATMATPRPSARNDEERFARAIAAMEEADRRRKG